MTPQSKETILAALRDYKRENLAKARVLSQGPIDALPPSMTYEQRLEAFDAHMAVDDQIELAMQEISVAQ